ncbi:ubiquitin carboxyl-terminal hydrolase 12-like isoform X6 [Camellia sinensis]|uniref:ubiquitin carboxyl-terminal hydrolase 12-like isoform X6 n=1 Tax=Camellia sinensis TaxID=4442 RepID=UPI001035E790|nr:ubiquitin carboxyl-terminal hydrolase 12-like isoform X6 [Camellia sinensis]
MEEEKSCHPIPPLHNANSEVTRSLREIPPAHFIFKIESFSQLSQLLSDAEVQNCESDIFEASGYKWLSLKLSFYPNGDKKRKGEGHISLYLVIAETSNLPLGWEVSVNFKLFVYDQIQDKYMTIQDANGKVRRFHGMKTEWGFAQLLPLSTFNDADNGYLICDTCVFGAEVFVINYPSRGQSINILKELDRTYTWKIDNFSSLDGQIHYSDVFTFGNRKWFQLFYFKLHLLGYIFIVVVN